MPDTYNNLKKINRIVLTVLNGATVSDWVRMPSAVVKVLGFKTPTNTPITTCVFDVREQDVTGTVYPVAADLDIASKLTLSVNGLGAFGSRAMAPLGSYVDGFHEVRITLGSVISGDGEFYLNVPSTTTE